MERGIMGFLEWLTEFWKQEQQHWTLCTVQAPQIQRPADTFPDGHTLEPHKAYVTLKMRSMAIDASRIGWNRFHAALLSRCQLGLRDGSQMDIRTVLSPDFLHGLDQKHLERVLHMDRMIFGPAAYIGGPLFVEIGVFAVKHADLASPFLSLLEELAGTAGVSFVSAAMPFAGPIKNGIELLTGTADAVRLQIALLREFDPIVTGWSALIRQPASNLSIGDLSVRDGNYELLYKSKPLDTQYLLFSFEGSSTRPDWGRFPELREAYAEFRNHVAAGRQNEAKYRIRNIPPKGNRLS